MEEEEAELGREVWLRDDVKEGEKKKTIAMMMTRIMLMRTPMMILVRIMKKMMMTLPGWGREGPNQSSGPVS